MTAYGSYNSQKKPIISDNVAILSVNTIFGFITGFAVWTYSTFLEGVNPSYSPKAKSLDLMFVTLPAAFAEINSSSLWTLLFAISFFLLGIDTLISFVEGLSTIICDSDMGSRFPKKVVAFGLCILGAILGIPFCTNWGFALLDVIDHYIILLLLIIGDRKSVV